MEPIWLDSLHFQKHLRKLHTRLPVRLVIVEIVVWLRAHEGVLLSPLLLGFSHQCNRGKHATTCKFRFLTLLWGLRCEVRQDSLGFEFQLRQFHWQELLVSLLVKRVQTIPISLEFFWARNVLPNRHTARRR